MSKRWAVKVAVAVTLIGSGCGRSLTPPSSPILQRAALGVVAIAVQHGSDRDATLCSGTLVAPNLVLTARHCIASAIRTMPVCDSAGQSQNGEHVVGDVAPASLSVYGGARGDVLAGPPIAFGKRAFRPDTKVLCDADLAFIVLDRPLPEVTIVPMRLSGEIERGDVVVPVGFGGGAPGTRSARSASEVLSVGPGANAETGAVLGPSEFEVDGGTCAGDSGGPAIDARSGEVVGVVSRGGGCRAGGNHVYTRVGAYAALAVSALAWARESDAQASRAGL